MKSYIELVSRYLKKQLKRSMLTIIGIILSVALITSSGILAASIKYSEIEYIKKANGNFHAIFNNLNKEQLDIVKNHIMVEKAGEIIFLGSYKIPGSDVYINAQSLNADALEMFGYNLKSGNLPEKDYEIVLEEWVLDEFEQKLQIGQELQIEFKVLGNTQNTTDTTNISNTEETKNSNTENSLKKHSGQSSGETFILTGVIESISTSQITGYSKALLTPDTINSIMQNSTAFSHIRYNVPVGIKESLSVHQVVRSIQTSLELKDKSIYYNTSLLLAMNNYTTVDWPTVFLALIIVIATICSIHNVFNISALERMRQFGLLRSIGTTPKQIERIIYGEALLLNLFSIPAGIILGIYGVKVLIFAFSLLNGVVTNIIIPGRVIITGIILSFISVLLSALRPAQLAGKVSPLEALKNRSGILKESTLKHKSWHNLIKFAFGIGGLIAYQNLWRNKKRVLVTLSSMSISIVLFIVFNFFISSANPAKVLEGLYPAEYALQTDAFSGAIGFTEEDYNTIRSFKDIEEIYTMQYDIFGVLYSEGGLTDDYREYIKGLANQNIEKDPDTGLYLDTGELYGYSENMLSTLGKYLVEGAIDIKKMSEEPYVLIFNDIKGRDDIKVTTLKPGDEIIVKKAYLENNKITYSEQKKFIVAGIINTIPIRGSSTALGLSMFAHENIFKEATGLNTYKRFDIKLNAGADSEQIEVQLKDISGSISQGKLISFEDEIKKLEKEKKQFSLLLYTLITVIVLIGLFSIVNTISTNLILRTSEFGILRAIGITKRQLKSIIRMEGFYYGIISSFWGTISGVILAYVLFQLARKELTYLIWIIPWQAIILSWSASILLGVLATFLPSRRISSANIISSIKTVE